MYDESAAFALREIRVLVVASLACAIRGHDIVIIKIKATPIIGGPFKLLDLLKNSVI